jgi:hypothetical protein
VAEKPPPKPAWYKNTYFWIAAILAILGLLGFVNGEQVIRDPGQKRESGLTFLYLGAAAVMFINGLVSHFQTVQHYREAVGERKE